MKLSVDAKWARWLVAGAFMMLSSVGCGKAKAPWEIVYPAKGTISFNGKPLAGAQITLVSEDKQFPNSVRPTATSKDDGSFEIGTYSHKDGAPQGSYKVLVLHYPVVGSKENPSAGPNDLPPKYSKVDTTDLTYNVTAPTATGEIVLTK